MKEAVKAFLENAHEKGALEFGEFTLKSGRISPYFVNSGSLNDGASLQALGALYADAIIDRKILYDLCDTLFGPAYKGIPLVAITSASLFQKTEKSVAVAYNRKEEKDHGEGGLIIGNLCGNVVIVDDVITAGTATRESITMIREAGAWPVGIVVLVDRQERGNGELSAIQEIKQEFGIPVHSVITFADIREFCESKPELRKYLPAMDAYHKEYGTA